MSKAKRLMDYSGKFYLKHLSKTDQYLWMSERDGWNHLYLIDAKTSKAQQLTQGDWVVRGVDRLDETKGESFGSALVVSMPIKIRITSTFVG